MSVRALLTAFPPALALLLLPAVVGATSYVDRPLEQRIARAERVVLARVLSTEVEGADGPAPRPMTVVTVEVEETLKGPGTAKKLIVRQLGGSRGGWEAHLPGAATFESGERAVLLLRCRPQPEDVPVCSLAGLRDAKLRVVSSGDREEVLVSAVAHDRITRVGLQSVRTIAREHAEVKR